MQWLPASTYWPDPAGNTEPVNDETELHLGKVRAYRWWTMTAPDLTDWPAGDVLARWDPGWLQATNGTEWLPGVNTAVCKNDYMVHPDTSIPDPACSCGFWAYWKPQHHPFLAAGRLPVFGAIDATGDIEICEYMMRAAEAQIVALHLPIAIGPKLPPAAPPDPWANFPGKVYTYPGRDPDTGEYNDFSRKRVVPAPPSQEEIAEAGLRGEAWCAVIGDRLRQLYPGAEVCETRDLLLANYPPDPGYGAMSPCQWCRAPGAGYAHEFACQANPHRGPAA